MLVCKQVPYSILNFGCKKMEAFFNVMLLLAACLHCANSKVATVKEEEEKKHEIDCSAYIIRPEDIAKMSKCIDQAMINEIIKNVTEATNGKIRALEKQLPRMKSLFTQELQELRDKVHQLEIRVNTSCAQDCQEWMDRGFHTSGVYQVCPGNEQPIVVYCDMETDGGGWIVFQRRVDGSANFTQPWSMYKHGFGDLNGGDFWLGLEKITHFMNVPNKLRIDLVSYENKTGHGQYNNFNISNEDTNYVLTVSDFTGNIHDQLNYSSGAAFSTYDQDHDSDSRNCAQEWHGVGYWYYGCDKVNTFPYTMLNGKYPYYGPGGTNPRSSAVNNIYWYGWPRDRKESFKALIKTKMMFKRK